MRNVLVLTLFYALNTQPLLADQIDPEQKTEDDPQAEVENQPDIGEIPQLDGPNGVTEELNSDEEKRDAFDGPDLFEPWFNWKEERLEMHGLSLGFKAWFLIQAASESMADSDDAAGSIYRLQGSWTAFSGDSGQVGQNRMASRKTIRTRQQARACGPVRRDWGCGTEYRFRI